MRVLFVNTTDQGGGAAIAASRLMKALREKGVNTRMLVNQKKGDEAYVAEASFPLLRKYRFLKERWGIFRANGYSRKNLFAVDTASSGTDITGHPLFMEADIIHLHWVNQGFLSLRSIGKILNSGKPVVWTLHDMWEFTGICHYTNECSFYKTGCGNCPYLLNPGENDISCQVFERKRKLYTGHSVQFVAVSSWLARMAKESCLLQSQPVMVIPNALPVSSFPLRERREARRFLSLPEDRRILVFGAVRMDDPRKGLALLKKSVQLLLDRGEYKREQLHLALFGGVKDAGVFNDMPIEYTHFGFLSQEQAAYLYSAADVAVIPSRYETFGQTVIEAQACGCVPVTFTGSGQMDIIRHKENGYLAENQSVWDFADGISWALHNGIQPSELRKEVFDKYSEEVVAEKYINLYRQII